MVIKLDSLVNKFGLIGRDISYSFSRSYFTTKFEQENIDASYQNFDVLNASSLRNLLKQERVKGYNVTIPYKETVIPMLDKLHDAAAQIGAVNTIKTEKNGSLTGYNTDYIGFKGVLLEQFKFTLLRQEYDDVLKEMRLEFPHKALILGTGGASKGVHYGLNLLGVDCTFISRKRKATPEKNILSYEDITEKLIKEHTFIINCTPLGTSPNTHLKPAIPYEFIDETHVAFDLIYNPAETVFLKLASQNGATILNGQRMLELQAEASWEIWNRED